MVELEKKSRDQHDEVLQDQEGRSHQSIRQLLTYLSLDQSVRLIAVTWADAAFGMDRYIFSILL